MPSHDHRPPSLSGLMGLLPALAAAASGALLMLFTILRETPIFWRNEGGYPYWLRDVVLDGFHPLIVVCLGALACAVWRLLFTRHSSFRIWLSQTALVMLGVLLVTMSLTMAVTNNVVNVIEGRPLHSHPKM